MWAGSIGHGVEVAAEAVGLAPREEGLSTGDRARILRFSRSVVSLWCAMALGLLVLVSSLLIGRRAAVVAGVLLAAEPFLAGHSHVLHTDALVTMFGALAVVGLAASCRDRASGPDRRLVVLAGIAAGVAVLTKLNAVPLVLGGAAVALVAQIDWRHRRRAQLRRSILVGGAFLAVAAVTFFAAWPALWVDPLHELQRLPDSIRHLNEPHPTFFRSAVTTEPGPRYYLYALAFRLSPWLLVAATISVLAVGIHLVRSRQAGDLASARSPWPPRVALVTLLLAPVPYALLITFTGQKYDRYALPVVPYLAMLSGVALAVAAARWQARFGNRLLRPLAIVATVAVFWVTVAAQPYAISYANPLLGGQERARNNILLGWGEGLEVMGAEIRRREGDRCDQATVSAPNMWLVYVAIPCGQLVEGEPVSSYDYVVRYISVTQRSPRHRLFPATERLGRLVKEVKIDGVTYAELWHIDR
jgi:4-amino-4-deoxy-L-arabinose transferase-like glycosyltransferase